jgi:hypothetical protein
MSEEKILLGGAGADRGAAKAQLEYAVPGLSCGKGNKSRADEVEQTE